MPKCPVCGAEGEDLIFEFYCSNLKCRNFNKSTCQEKVQNEDDITKILHNMWKAYGRGESESEFYTNFFTEGGKFSRYVDDNGEEVIRTIEPEWLKLRRTE
jgi:hypothetical protein